jgi:hypothetical protein
MDTHYIHCDTASVPVQGARGGDRLTRKSINNLSGIYILIHMTISPLLLPVSSPSSIATTILATSMTTHL